MFKAKIRNIFFFFLIKYLVLYILFMFKNNDYSLIQLNRIKNSQDVIYYLWIFLFLPVVNFVLFGIPIYYLFKIKNGLYFLLLMSSIFIAEYFIYTYPASSNNLKNGLYNGIISAIVFCAIFYRTVSSKFSHTQIA